MKVGRTPGGGFPTEAGEGFKPGLAPLVQALNGFLSASVRCTAGKDAARKSCRRLLRALGERSFNKAVEDALSAEGTWAIKQVKNAAAGNTKRKAPKLSLKERMALSQKGN